MMGKGNRKAALDYVLANDTMDYSDVPDKWKKRDKDGWTAAHWYFKKHADIPDGWHPRGWYMRNPEGRTVLHVYAGNPRSDPEWMKAKGLWRLEAFFSGDTVAHHYVRSHSNIVCSFPAEAWNGRTMLVKPWLTIIA